MTELRVQIRHLMDEDPDRCDPRDIAAALKQRLRVKDYGSVLDEVLPEYVRLVIMSSRHQAARPAPRASSKVTAIREWRARLLNQIVDVSFDEGKQKRLGDCTADDLLVCAEQRYKLAERVRATGDQFMALHRAVQECGGVTLSDVPDDALRGVYERAA